MKPSLRDAYEKLGFSPLGEFQDCTTGPNRVGATTWMIVEAALAVLDGQDVLIIGRTLKYTTDLAKLCIDYVLKLQDGRGMGIRTHSKGASSRHYDIQGAGNIHWASSRTVSKFWIGRRQGDFKVFRDAEFHTMALQRRDGPFAEIRRLNRKSNGGFAAYTATDEYLFDLTDEGARQVADADPYRVVVND